MSIHHKVHDVDPALQGDDLEDGDPGVTDVVEVDGAFERVVLACRAVGVVLVPVDAGGVAGTVIGLVVQATGRATATFPTKGGHAPAGAHATLPGLGADEGTLILILCLVVRLQVHAQGAAGGGKRQRQSWGAGFSTEEPRKDWCGYTEAHRGSQT